MKTQGSAVEHPSGLAATGESLLRVEACTATKQAEELHTFKPLISPLHVGDKKQQNDGRQNQQQSKLSNTRNEAAHFFLRIVLSVLF